MSADWDKVDLSLKIPVRGHIEARHSLSTGTWTAPVFETNPNISVSGISPGLNYGQQCFEGMKAFRQSSGDIVIFRPEFHATRIAKSAASVCLPAPPKDLFIECIRAAVAGNAELVPPTSCGTALYIRPVLFGSSAQLTLMPPEECILAVYVYPLLPFHGLDAIDALVLEDYDRTAPFGMGPFKVGGNYSPVWRHAAAAKEKGYGITLHLDSATRTNIDEFSTSGFLGMKSNGSQKTLIFPRSENAVNSVTSDSIVRMAELQGWTVQRDEVSRIAIRKPSLLNYQEGIRTDSVKGSAAYTFFYGRGGSGRYSSSSRAYPKRFSIIYGRKVHIPRYFQPGERAKPAVRAGSSSGRHSTRQPRGHRRLVLEGYRTGCEDGQARQSQPPLGHE